MALAAEALEAGDAPFGSVLVCDDDPAVVVREDRNRTMSLGDATRHPEFELARWAAGNCKSFFSLFFLLGVDANGEFCF